MNEDEMKELLIRMDERGKRIEEKFDAHSEVANKRLDAHAESIKSLKEWRSYLSGAWAVIAAGLGLHIKGGGH